MATTPGGYRCPYQGLIPYGEAEAEFFFGRESWIKIIENNLLASRLTLFYGPSGVGKSSVLLAGVVSRLKLQAQETMTQRDLSPTLVIVCRDWRDEPLGVLREKIQGAFQTQTGTALASDLDSCPDLRSLLKKCSQELTRLKEDDKRTPGKILLILDQFEEYFLYHPSEVGANSFAKTFPEAVNDLELPLHVLISLREDSLAKLDQFKGQIPKLFANRLRINHLDRAAAIEAILKPVEEFNRRLPEGSRKASVEPRLVHDVLEQVKVGRIHTDEEPVANQTTTPAEPDGQGEKLLVETPFLQLVMTRLWEEESEFNNPPLLRLETLQNLGGASAIVREHLERLMRDLPEAAKDVAAIIFDKLVTSGLTKIAYPVFELTDSSKVEDHPNDLVTRQDLEQLLEHLSGGNQRILRRVAPAPEQLHGDPCYEIFHDVLAKPILEWKRNYRHAKELEAEKQRHIAELQQERQRKEEALAVERQRQRKLWREKWLSIGGLSLIILGMGFIILWLRAKEQKLKTIEAAQQFKAQQMDQIDALVQALQAAHSLTEFNLDPASLRDVASNLRHILDNIQERSKADLLSAKDNAPRLIKLLPDGTGAGILFQNNQFVIRHFTGQTLLHLGPESAQTESATTLDKGINGFAFADDGQTVAIVTKAGVVELWNRRREKIGRTSQAVMKKLPAIAVRTRLSFSPDGKRLAFIDTDNHLHMMDLPMSRQDSLNGKDAPRFGPAQTAVTIVRFSPDGKFLATATQTGEVIVLDGKTGRRLLTPTNPPDPGGGPVFSMDFDPRGKALAISSPAGVRIWQKKDNGPWAVSLLPSVRTSQVRFDPTGHLLAVATFDGRSRLWAIGDGSRPQEVASFLNQAPVQDVRFNAEGSKLFSVSTAGRMHEWQVPAVAQPTTSQRRYSALAFSPDARWLAGTEYPDAQKLGQGGHGESKACLMPLHRKKAPQSATDDGAAGSCPGTPLPLQEIRTGPLPSQEARMGIVMAQMAISPGGARVAGLSWRRGGWLWDQKGSVLARLATDNVGRGPYSAISFSPDGQRFAYVARGGEEPQLMLCGIPSSSGKEGCRKVPLTSNGLGSTASKPGSQGLLTSVRFLPLAPAKDKKQLDPADSVLLTSSDNGHICTAVLREAEGDLKMLSCQQFFDGGGNVWQLSVSPKGHTIGLAGFDGTLHLFRRGKGDRLTKALANPLNVSAGPLTDVSFSENGRTLAAVSLGGTASFWNDQGQRLASFQGMEDQGGEFMKATFLPNDRQVALATISGTVQIKEVQNLPQLLNRGCQWLSTYLNNPANQSVKNSLRFCKF